LDNPLTPGTTYQATADSIRDLAGNTLSPTHTVLTFVAGLGPRTTITRSGNNYVDVSWPADYTGFILEQESYIADPFQAPSPWTRVSGSPVTGNGRITLTVPVGSGNAFFRLRQ